MVNAVYPGLVAHTGLLQDTRGPFKWFTDTFGSTPEKGCGHRAVAGHRSGDRDDQRKVVRQTQGDPDTGPRDGTRRAHTTVGGEREAHPRHLKSLDHVAGLPGLIHRMTIRRLPSLHTRVRLIDRTPSRCHTDAVTSPLPRPLSSFIGRQDVLAQARELLGRHRLLTLTGAGGSGKTRLGIELAARVSGDFPDGAHFVALAAIRDPALVPSAIARSLGLQDPQDVPLVQHLAGYLAERTALLVLDNFEQVLSGATVVADLLAAGTGTRIVVTSRAPLHLSGEQEFPVPPLPIPDQSRTVSPADLEACESTALFLARARAVVPGFAAEGPDAAAVAGIARRLDGLPLAIELAAARTKLLPPIALFERLDHALGLLIGGSRDLPDRQRTLRNTIAWSHDLLSDGARRLFATLAVFRGGAGLDDLEAVCAGSLELGLPVLDGVQELLDQSLLRRSASSPHPRYTMLETVREFAAERLEELPEAATVRTAHAYRFAALVHCLERPPVWPDDDFLARLDRDHDNLRAALDLLQNRDRRHALQMAAELTTYWSIRGHFGEGRSRLEDLLTRCVEACPERVAGLNAAGWLALDQGDLEDVPGSAQRERGPGPRDR